MAAASLELSASALKILFMSGCCPAAPRLARLIESRQAWGWG